MFMKGAILRILFNHTLCGFHMPARPLAPVSFFHPLSRYALAVGACLVMAVFPHGAVAADEGEPAPKPAERIRQLQDEAGKLRTKAEADYQAAETACYKRFLVNSCINNAKAERLAAIRRARELEAEAHQIDLAERQKKAAEMAKKAEEHGSGQELMGVSSPSADVDVVQRPEKTISSSRATQSGTASSKARERARADRRAEAARRDRERYDAKIRELEEKRARDADGR
jgi:hypothetical protein